MDEENHDSATTPAAEGLSAELFASAVKRVREWPDVGTCIIPRENTFAAHLQLVKHLRAGSIAFQPEAYPSFDALVVVAAGRPALFDPQHKLHKRHGELRDNLAVLRNFIAGHYYQDGEAYADGGVYGAPELAEMASELGRAIRNEKRHIPRFIAPFLNTRLLNMHGDGASYAYWFLRQRQRQDGWPGDVKAAIRGWLGLPRNEWDLPPEEMTPFGKYTLDAEPPPLDVLCMSDEQLERYVREHEKPANREIAKYEQGRQEALPVEENLTTTRKREAVDHGITILRWFKNIQFSDKSAMEMLDSGTPEEKGEMVGLVSKFVDYYQQITARALQRNPELAKEEQVEEANKVAEVLRHFIKLLAALEKPVSIAQTQQISTDATRQPEHWNDLANHTVDRLMDTLKGGLETVVSAFEQQQHDADQQQEQIVEQATEQALTNSDQARRKRRRKRQSSSMGTAKKQQRLDQAIRADDYALGQGVHASTGGSQARYVQGQIEFKQSLQVREAVLKDMDLVKALGKTLAKSGQLGKEAAKPTEGGGGGAGSLPSLSSLKVADVNMNDKLAPDSKDVASRIIDQRKREQQPGGKKQL